MWKPWFDEFLVLKSCDIFLNLKMPLFAFWTQYFRSGFLKGIPIRKWRASFRRGFANFWDDISQFGTGVNFCKKINSPLCQHQIFLEIRGENLKKPPQNMVLPTILLLINSVLLLGACAGYWYNSTWIQQFIFEF